MKKKIDVVKVREESVSSIKSANDKMRRDIDNMELQDELRRTNISKFLGHFEPRGAYNIGEEREPKTLPWSEIYFYLGRLVEKKENFQDLEDIREQIRIINFERNQEKEVKNG